MRERIGPNLEMNHFGHCSLAGLAVEWRARSPRRPNAFSFPTRIRIIDAAVHSLREKAKRIRYTHNHKFPVDQRNQRVRRIACDDRRIVAEAQCIKAIDPIVVMRVIAAPELHVFEFWPRRLIERPSLGALPASCEWAVQRPFALPPVEAREMAAA